MKRNRIVFYIILSLIIAIACQEEFADRDFPSVITTGTILKGSEGVEFTGDIIGRKSAEIKELGFIWQDNEDPVENPGFRINLLTTIKTGKFNILIASSIKKNTEYFVRAYAKVANRIIYGEIVKFTSAEDFEPGIISVLPLTGQVGDTVTIKGGIFNTDPSRNIVRFNDVEAEITSLSDSVIRCIVPFSLTSKESTVSIFTDGTTKIFPEKYKLFTPSIISVSPMEIPFLDTLSITGSGFHKNIQLNKVKFGNFDATIITCSPTTITVRVPFINDSLCFVSVTVSGQTAVSQKKVKIITPGFDFFLPEEAGFLDTLTIYCKNLNVAIIKSVLIDNIPGRIITSGASKILVEIPTGLKKEYSDVKVDFSPGEYTFPYKFRLKQPVITKLSSETVFNQQVLTIIGFNFNPLKTGNQVSIVETIYGRSYSFIPIFSSSDSLQIKIMDPYKGSSLPSGRYTISVKTCEENYSWINTIVVADRWRKLNNFPGGEIYKGVGYAINGKGYAGMGTKISNDLQKVLWEFNPATETWIRKADFPGAGRILPFIFVNSRYGFVGGGQSYDNTASQVPYTDFYRYNPVLNTWTRMADAPLVEKSYIGGFASTISNLHAANLAQGFISRYAEETNIWSQIPAEGSSRYNYPGTFSINNKIYFVCGMNINLANGTTNMVWEFDTETNIMTRKKDFPGLSRYGGFGFSINNTGFIGCGMNVIYSPVSVKYLNTVYKYHPENDTWEQIESFPGNNLLCTSVFVIGNKAYLVGGYNQISINSEVWEFYPGESF
jgi:hypothetical protein